MRALAWWVSASALALIGLVLTFSGGPDPLPYVGGAFILLAPIVALVGLAQSRGGWWTRVIALVIVAACLLPLGFLAWVFYVLANDSS